MEKAFFKIWIGQEVNHKISLFELYKEADKQLAKLTEVMKTHPLIVISEAINSYYQETFPLPDTKKPSSPCVNALPSVESSVESSAESSVEPSIEA